MVRAYLAHHDTDAPKGRISVGALGHHWLGRRIEIATDLPIRILQEPDLLSLFRGVLGKSLRRSASAAAQQGQRCTFAPPCAYSIFHNDFSYLGEPEQVRPFFLSAEELGGHVLFRISLFGRAADWEAAFEEAMTDALRAFQPRGFGGTPKILARATDAENPVSVQDRQDMMISFLTPVILRRRGQIVFDARALIWSLRRRVEGLARWHGFELMIDENRFSLDLKTLAASDELFREPRRWKVRHTGEQRRGYQADLFVRGASSELASLLAIGQIAGVGSRVVEGAGRYSLAKIE